MFEKTHIPKGATHFIILFGGTYQGGWSRFNVGWFMVKDGKIKRFDTDNDDEYPQWVDTKVRMDHLQIIKEVSYEQAAG